MQQDLEERLRELSGRMDRADAFFAHHQSLTGGAACPVTDCKHCLSGEPPYGEDHPTFKYAEQRADLASRNLGEATEQLKYLGFYWDGAKSVPWAEAFPDTPNATAQGPTMRRSQ